MAFCPNCGTPNTDQADKCVSCGFELATRQKAKFKGTIMMTGVQAPAGARPGAPAAPAAPPGPARTPVPTPGAAKNLAFEKTMLGVASPPAKPGSPAAASPPPDFGTAATVEQSQVQSYIPQAAPHLGQGSRAEPESYAESPAPRAFSSDDDDGDLAMPQQGSGKLVAIVVAVLIVLALVFAVIRMGGA